MASLESMKEHCTSCGAELELGQIGKCDDCQQSEMVTITVAVLCTNQSGEREFVISEQTVTSTQYEEGVHYEEAKQDAKAKGFEEPMIAFDEDDTAASQLETLAASM